MGDTSLETQLRGFGAQWAEAERTLDVARLAPMLAEDFVGVGPLGFTLTKQQWLGARASGDLAHAAFAWDPADIHLHAGTAIVVGVQTQDSTYQGRPAPSGPFRVTQVLLRSGDGSWVIAGMHLCVIANLAAARP
jgi:ketosteroid isomerase-like protein